jgi:hypothetical protein
VFREQNTLPFSETLMTESEFWACIEHVDREALHDGDEDAGAESLIAHLATLPVKELENFEEHLARALYRLDSARHNENAGDAADSEDGFLYARCYVVGQGKQHFDQVLADPTKMPQSLDEWFEPLIYVSQIAWSRITGNEPEEWDYFAPVNYETGSNKEGWK